MKIEEQKLTLPEDLIAFSKYTRKFLGITLPMEYLEQSSVYVYKNETNQFLAGYLINEQYPFRLLDQIPDSCIEKHAFLSSNGLHDIFEINAFWISPRLNKGRDNLYIWHKMTKNAKALKRKHLLISANTKNKTILKYHALMHPTRIYEGKPYSTSNEDCSYPTVRYSFVKRTDISLAWVRGVKHIVKRITT